MEPTIKSLTKEIDALMEKAKSKGAELSTLILELEVKTTKKVEETMEGRYSFRPEELVFAATSRCCCGAGIAYPREGTGIHGNWYCSDILMGRAIRKGMPGSKEHDAPLPFAFYEIKSEDQPSAKGATTRPKEVITEL